MVILPLARAPRIINYLKPYVLKMHITNNYATAQVIHSPTATVASSASSQEKALRSSMETTRDVAAAAKIGKILAECKQLMATRDVATVAKIGNMLGECQLFKTTQDVAAAAKIRKKRAERLQLETTQSFADGAKIVAKIVKILVERQQFKDI